MTVFHKLAMIMISLLHIKQGIKYTVNLISEETQKVSSASYHRGTLSSSALFHHFSDDEAAEAPLFHWVATLGKLFTHIAFPVSQLQETGVQKGVFGA